MSEIKQGSGSHILADRHARTLGKDSLPRIQDILIVEDNNIDSERLRATIHLLLGRAIEIRVANTVNSAIDHVLNKKPDIVLLDDYLKPADSANETIPFLRRAGFSGHIIVISGELDRQRRQRLFAVGASAALHKDDVDSSHVAEALIKVYAKGC
ncbi:MAG: response regulator [Pseudomonadota bacterium]